MKVKIPKCSVEVEVEMKNSIEHKNTVHEKVKIPKCNKGLSDNMISKNVHENLHLSNMKANAEKFASIINNQTKEQKSGENKLNKIAGINLDQNRFSELANLDGRFWDSNSNANENGGMKNTISSKSVSKNVSNLGPKYFLKTVSKPTFKSTRKSNKNVNKDAKYDPKKDRQNVAFHKARKNAIEESSTIAGSTNLSPKSNSVGDDVDMSLFFSPRLLAGNLKSA